MSPVHTADVMRRNNVRVAGNPDGRTLLLAHGFGCSQATWSLVAPQLEAGYTVVLFDHVGAGESDWSAYDRGKYGSLHGYASDVLEIIEALSLSDVTFVGHSVSAMVGVLAANRAPERFERLVLISPSPRYIDDDPYVGGFRQADIEALLDSLDANYLGWSQETAPMIMGTPDRPELEDRLTASFCRVDPQIAGHFGRVTFLSDNRADLAHVVVPTLILQSRDDVIAPLDVGEYVHRSIPHSELALIDTTGHVPILSAPDQVVDRIRRFLS